MKEKENAHLFDNLGILNDCGALLHRHAYSVVFITLKDMKRADYKMQTEKFSSITSDVVSTNSELLNSPMLNTAQKNLLTQHQDETSTISNLMDALSKTSICMQLYFQKKVIILIDEQALLAYGVIFLYRLHI